MDWKSNVVRLGSGTSDQASLATLVLDTQYDEPQELVVTVGASLGQQGGFPALETLDSFKSSLAVNAPIGPLSGAANYQIRLMYGMGNANVQVYADWPVNGWSSPVRADRVQVQAMCVSSYAGTRNSPYVFASLCPGSAAKVGQLTQTISFTCVSAVTSSFVIPPFATHYRISSNAATFTNTKLQILAADSATVVDSYWIGPTVTSPGARTQIYDIPAGGKLLTALQNATDTFYVVFYIDPP